jgi:uncharacterized protein (TIGR02001 family)
MHLACIVLALVLAVGFPAFGAQDEEKAEPKKEDCPTFGASVDFLSQYIFRGVAFSASSAVIQPSVTIGYKGLALNVWGNFDTSEKLFGKDPRWNETDITLSYSREIFKGLTANVGTIYYVLVNSPKDSVEAFAGLSYAFPWFTLGVTGYREFKYFPGWWMQIDLTRNFKLPYRDMSLDLGVSVGYLDSNPQGFADWHSGQLSAALNVPIGKHITVSPKIGFAFPITSDGRDNIKVNSWDGDAEHVFGGIRIAASF